MLEEKQHAVMQQLRSSTSSLEMSSSPTTPVSLLNPTAGTSELSMLRESLQRELENQRRIFDDLEFQQLEVGDGVMMVWRDWIQNQNGMSLSCWKHGEVGFEVVRSCLESWSQFCSHGGRTG